MSFPLTSGGMSVPEEGSGAGGLCQPPQFVPMWLQRVLVPVDCVEVRLVVHQTYGADRYTLSLEVSQPHTRELLAHHVDPTRRYPTGVTLARAVSEELHTVLLHLTDPEPF
jgi:hypothetical protein